MAKKELKGIVKLVVPAKQANPAPPIGPALGQNAESGTIEAEERGV